MVPVIAYHSQNIRGDRPADNDHVALAADLRALRDSGRRIIPLDLMTDWLDGLVADLSVAGGVVLTFDDGCDFDFRDIDYPGHGLQRGFAGILEDFSRELSPPDRALLHATSFVIASEDARRQIDARSLFGRGWMSDDWWREAEEGSLLSVENHGWDHNHPDLEGDSRGNFHTVDTHEQCLEQVVRAADFIARKSGRRPAYFAYPFGQSSDYIREEFFPEFAAQHRCRAALGSRRGAVTRGTDRWNLPRYVCGRDWSSSGQLLALLKSC